MRVVDCERVSQSVSQSVSQLFWRIVVVVSYQVHWNIWGIRAHGIRQGWIHRQDERSLLYQEPCIWIQALSGDNESRRNNVSSLVGLMCVKL